MISALKRAARAITLRNLLCRNDGRYPTWMAIDLALFSLLAMASISAVTLRISRRRDLRRAASVFLEFVLPGCAGLALGVWIVLLVHS